MSIQRYGFLLVCVASSGCIGRSHGSLTSTRTWVSSVDGVTTHHEETRSPGRIEWLEERDGVKRRAVLKPSAPGKDARSEETEHWQVVELSSSEGARTWLTHKLDPRMVVQLPDGVRQAPARPLRLEAAMEVTCDGGEGLL